MAESLSAAPPFLRTHRAITACARELETLADAAVDEVEAWSSVGLPDKPVARRTPGRCVVQMGQVALSMTWLRSSTDDIGAGELLVAVWHGVIGPQREYQFERVTQLPRAAAREVWERVFHPGVVGVDGWRWIEVGQEAPSGHTGASLASFCVARLRDAYVESSPVATTGNTPYLEVQ